MFLPHSMLFEAYVRGPCRKHHEYCQIGQSMHIIGYTSK
jgi:hypothetical protein